MTRDSTWDYCSAKESAVDDSDEDEDIQPYGTEGFDDLEDGEYGGYDGVDYDDDLVEYDEPSDGFEEDSDSGGFDDDDFDE